MARQDQQIQNQHPKIMKTPLFIYNDYIGQKQGITPHGMAKIRILIRADKNVIAPYTFAPAPSFHKFCMLP